MPFSKNLFSIGISIFQVNHLDNETLCKQVEYFCTNPNNNKIYTRDMGLDNPYLKELNEIVIERSQIILNGITNYPNLKVFLQKVWGNHNLNESISTPHCHRGSFLSAIYYPQSTDGIIQFYSPFTDALLSHVPVQTDNYHEFNSAYYDLSPKTGWLVLFPGSLMHRVPPSKEERYSIVYNIGVDSYEEVK
tara:strand:- start:834 stop:1406 length:573 start_codon:yes stop_codon:yes gene_type:complete